MIQHSERVYMHHPGVGPSDSPKLWVLNFSGGKQSSSLLWMVLRGDIEVDLDRFIALTADPGMENSETYDYIAMMQSECAKRGVICQTAPGPNLYKDILALDKNKPGRIDNPPWWTTPKGRLLQKCTRYYKIAPMDRVLRKILAARFGISAQSRRPGHNIVEKWIGFSYSEVIRMKPPGQRYVYFRYPLIDQRLTNGDILGYYQRNKLPIPPRSVCNACFANGVAMLRDMHGNRPADWAQAVTVDETIRNLSCVGVNKPVFVSKTRLPLLTLADQDFQPAGTTLPLFDSDGWSCDSGYCFT